MQIGTSGPHETINFGVMRSKVKVTRGQVELGHLGRHHFDLFSGVAFLVVIIVYLHI